MKNLVNQISEARNIDKKLVAEILREGIIAGNKMEDRKTREENLKELLEIVYNRK